MMHAVSSITLEDLLLCILATSSGSVSPSLSSLVISLACCNIVRSAWSVVRWKEQVRQSHIHSISKTKTSTNMCKTHTTRVRANNQIVTNVQVVRRGT